MRLKYKMLALVILSLLSSCIVARDDEINSDWRVVAYDDTSVFIIQGNGVEHITLPETAQNRVPRGNTNLMLSPDERYIVYSDEIAEDTSNLGTFIFDRETSRVQTIEHPALTRTSDLNRNEFVKIGRFSPDGQEVVISVAGWDYGTLLIVDVRTGEVTAEATTEALFNEDEDNRNYALIPQWTNEGMLLYPHCFPCEGFVEGYAYRWQARRLNADAPIISQTDIPYRVVSYNLISDYLANTGEVIMAQRNENYLDLQREGLGYNVLQYVTPNTVNGLDASVIYSNPSVPVFLLSPRWVVDGEAYLLHNDNLPTATLVWRDGTSLSIDVEDAPYFVSGTPDGWLMRDETTFYHYVVNDDDSLSTQALPYENGNPQPFEILFVAETSPLGIDGLDPVQALIR